MTARASGLHSALRASRAPPQTVRDPTVFTTYRAEGWYFLFIEKRWPSRSNIQSNDPPVTSLFYIGRNLTGIMTVHPNPRFPLTHSFKSLNRGM